MMVMLTPIFVVIICCLSFEAGIKSDFARSLSENFFTLCESKGLERALEVFIQATFY